jgi:hypothetical protein
LVCEAASGSGCYIDTVDPVNFDFESEWKRAGRRRISAHL